MDLSVPPQPLLSPWFFIPFILRLSVLRSVWFLFTKIAAPEQKICLNLGHDTLGWKLLFERVALLMLYYSNYLRS
jgi:hypothetical protein